MKQIQFPIKVMQPVLAETVPVGDYLYQVKWDGMRWITYRSAHGIAFQTKNQKVFTTRFAELENSLDWLPHESMIDGEVVVLKDGAPHFPSLLRRLHSKSLKPQEWGAEYIIFDVLFWEGKDWRMKPLRDRLELLKNSIPPSERCHGIETFYDGPRLWKGIQELGLEGLVAKVPTSLYCGGKDRSWLKIKDWREESFLVGGLKFKEKTLQAVFMGMMIDEELVYVGTVSSGVTRFMRSDAALSLTGRASSPFDSGAGPTHDSGGTIRWVEPTIRLKTRFLEWTDGGKLRNAQIII